MHRIVLKCSKAKSTTSSKATTSKSAGITDKKLDSSKFENYFNFISEVKTTKPHQTLAINRGEKHKFLTVKVETNDYLKNDLTRFISNQYLSEGLMYPLRREVFTRSLDECFAKKCNCIGIAIILAL